MSALTADQLELLQCARDGVPMWGGSTATPRLKADLQLLLALGLVEPSADWPYQLTALALKVLTTIPATRPASS